MKIIVPVEIDRSDVENLGQFLETCPDQNIQDFIYGVLKKVHEVTTAYSDESEAIKKVNPFSIFEN